MQFDIFINFNGDCKEALALYSKVFKSEVRGLMTFGQMPPHPDYPLADEDKDKIMYASIKVGNNTMMFSDVPAGMSLTKGNNIVPTIGTKDAEEIRRMFNEMKVGGVVEMELQKTFWSDLYGSVVDKFGISWQFSQDSGYKSY